MKYQKIINLLDNTPNQQSKFRTKIWVEINDDSRGTYYTISKIKFKSSMLKSSWCDHSDTYTCEWNYNSRKIRCRQSEYTIYK